MTDVEALTLAVKYRELAGGSYDSELSKQLNGIAQELEKRARIGV